MIASIIKHLVCLFFIYNYVYAAIKPDKPGVMAQWKYTGCDDSDDFTPDPEDCEKFYRCSHGYQFSFKCGPGTGFDKRLKVCNFKDSIPECDDSSENVDDDKKGGTTKKDGSTGTSGSATTATTTTATTTTATTTTSSTTTSTSRASEVTDLDPSLCSKLTPSEKAIFCDSATFRQYYPNCCGSF